jgi:hypothetical protein
MNTGHRSYTPARAAGEVRDHWKLQKLVPARPDQPAIIVVDFALFSSGPTLGSVLAEAIPGYGVFRVDAVSDLAGQPNYVPMEDIAHGYAKSLEDLQVPIGIVAGYCSGAGLATHISAAFTSETGRRPPVALVTPTWISEPEVREEFASLRKQINGAADLVPEPWPTGDERELMTWLGGVLRADLNALCDTEDADEAEREAIAGQLADRYAAWLGFLLATSRSEPERPEGVVRIFLEEGDVTAQPGALAGVDITRIPLGSESLLTAGDLSERILELLELERFTMLREPTIPLSVRQEHRIVELRDLAAAAGRSDLRSSDVIAAMYRMDGQVDVASLRFAVQQALSEYPVLKVFYEIDPAGPRARWYNGAIPFRIDDLSAMGENAQAEAMTRLTLSSSRAFDLSMEPPVRAGVVILNERQCVLHLEVDHMVCDARSLELLLNHISRYYARATDQSLPEDIEVGNSDWPDYVRHENARLKTSDFSDSLRCWEELLALGGAVPTLPFGSRGRPALGEDRCPADSVYREILSHTVVHDLLARSRAEGVSPYILVLGLVQFAIRTVSGKLRVGVLGSVSNRGEKFQRTIGVFSNAVPFYVSYDAGDDLARGLLRTAESARLSLSNAWIPYPVLLERFNGTVSKNPRYEPRLWLRVDAANAVDRMTIPGVVCRPSGMTHGIYPGCLFFTVQFTRHGLAVLGSYDVTAFDKPTVALLVDEFRDLAQSLGGRK